MREAMFQVIRDAQGSAFITGVLLLMTILTLCGAAVYWLSFSWMLAIAVCWAMLMSVPFLVRGLSIWLVERQSR